MRPFVNAAFFLLFLALLVTFSPILESFGSPGTYVQLASTRSMSAQEWLQEQKQQQEQIHQDLFNLTEVPSYSWNNGLNAQAFH
jgi:hypothetical protein